MQDEHDHTHKANDAPPVAADRAVGVVGPLPSGAALSDAPECCDCGVETEGQLGQVTFAGINQRYVDHACQCPTGKKCYLTYLGARHAIQSFQTRRDNYRERGRHLTVYRCRECPHRHVGNQGNDQRRPRRPRTRRRA